MKIKSLWNWKWPLRSCSNHYKRNDIFNCSEWPRYSLHFKAKRNKGWTNCDKLLAMFRLVPKLSKARNMPRMQIWVKFFSQHCPPPSISSPKPNATFLFIALQQKQYRIPYDNEKPEWTILISTISCFSHWNLMIDSCLLGRQKCANELYGYS